MKTYRSLLLTTVFFVGTSASWASNDDFNDQGAQRVAANASRVKGYKPTPKHTKDILAAHRKMKATRTRDTAPVTLPPSFDFRQYANIFDQGQLGSCTANSLSGADYILAVQEVEAQVAGQQTLDAIKSAVQPGSRLMIYYDERAKEGTITQDAGASIGDGLLSLTTQGVCPETMWPYSDVTTGTNPPFTQQPSAEAYAAALNNRVLSDATHDSIDPTQGTQSDLLTAVKSYLVQKQPLSMGILLYPEFESDPVASTGIVPMPANTDPSAQIGGHAVLAVGYDDTKDMGNGNTGAVIFANSWNVTWGDKGFFYLPYNYFNPTNGWVDEIWALGKVTLPTVTFTPAVNPVTPPAPVDPTPPAPVDPTPPAPVDPTPPAPVDPTPPAPVDPTPPAPVDPTPPSPDVDPASDNSSASGDSDSDSDSDNGGDDNNGSNNSAN